MRSFFAPARERGRMAEFNVAVKTFNAKMEEKLLLKNAQKKLENAAKNLMSLGIIGNINNNNKSSLIKKSEPVPQNFSPNQNQNNMAEKFEKSRPSTTPNLTKPSVKFVDGNYCNNEKFENNGEKRRFTRSGTRRSFAADPNSNNNNNINLPQDKEEKSVEENSGAFSKTLLSRRVGIVGDGRVSIFSDRKSIFSTKKSKVLNENLAQEFKAVYASSKKKKRFHNFVIFLTPHIFSVFLWLTIYLNLFRLKKVEI